MNPRITLGLALAAACGLAQAQAGTSYHATFLEYSKGWGTVVADFDHDGHDDILVSGHDRDDRIWYRTPTGYVPGPQVLPFLDRHACTAADADRNGQIDLFCAIGAVKGTGAADKEYWLQGAGGVFVKQTGFGAEDPYGRGRRPIFFDMNHDGWPDLYLVNQATQRADGEPNINHVFINQGGHAFVEQQTIATGNVGFGCSAKGDVNGDGWDDLAICGDPGRVGHLFVNNRAGDFTALVTPATAVSWIDAGLVDVDGDGKDDLVLVDSRHDFQIWLNSGTSPYYPAPSFTYALPGRGSSVAIGDFDGNGRKDVYVVLQDETCTTSLVDLAPDLVFWGQPGGGWVAQAQPQESLKGCGHLAATVDGDRILLVQGGQGWNGPNYLLRWK